MQRPQVSPPRSLAGCFSPTPGSRPSGLPGSSWTSSQQGLAADDSTIKQQLREVRHDAADHLDALRDGLVEVLAAAGIAVCQARTGADAAGWLASALGRGRGAAGESFGECGRTPRRAGGRRAFPLVRGVRRRRYERPEEGVGHYWEITPPTGEAAWEAFSARPACPGDLRNGTVALLGVNAVSAEDGAVFFVAAPSQYLRDAGQGRKRCPAGRARQDRARPGGGGAGRTRHGALWSGQYRPGRAREGGREAEDGREAASGPAPAAFLPIRHSEAPEGSGSLAPGQEVSVILLDNGRSALLGGERFRELFLCIGCRACQRECPTFPYFGGSAGWKPRDYLFAFLRGANDSLSDCAQCGRCQALCPLDIPIPVHDRLCREEKEYPLRDRFYSHIHVLFLLSSRAAPLANRLFRLAPARVPVEWVAGLDRRRPLPRFYARDFEHEFRARQWPSGRKVVYYYGCYVNYTDPALGLDVARVLAHNFFEPMLPPPICCGVAAYSYGDMRLARRLASTNVRWLVEQVDRGLDIVVSCPSCALALQHHFPQILRKRSQAQRVAEHTLDVGAFLLREHAAGRLGHPSRPLTEGGRLPRPVPYARASTPGLENVALLSWSRGLAVQVVDRGAAGSLAPLDSRRATGYKSMEIGRELFFRHARARDRHGDDRLRRLRDADPARQRGGRLFTR